MRSTKHIALTLVVLGMLGSAPAEASTARRVGQEVGYDAAESALIETAATLGAAAIIGGLVWVWRHWGDTSNSIEIPPSLATTGAVASTP